MSFLYAKIKQRGKQIKIRKVLHSDEVLYTSAGKTILEEVPYSQDSILDDGAWYFIKDFSSSKYSIDLLSIDINSADYDSLTIEEFKQIDYIFSASDDQNERYFQKIGKAALVERKRLVVFGGRFEYYPNASSVIINEYPDAIYLRNRDILFFRKLSSLTGIFPEISELYREATNEETEEFLKMDFITTDGFTVELVHAPNRKRIAMAMEILKTLNPPQKKKIYSYIAEYCPGISNGKNSFIVKSNEDLSLVLYGIGQRFYTTPVGGEKRIANSVIKL